MNPHEYETYKNHCDRRTTLASQIIGRTSARIGITANLTPDDFFIPDDPYVDLAFVKIRGAKDTTTEETALDGKNRISWVPRDVYEDIKQYCADEGIDDDEDIFKIGKKHLGDQIKEAAEATAVATGEDDYAHVRSHDFRAYYATHMVRRLGVDRGTVKSMGGWSSDKAIEPYLAPKLPRDLQDSLSRAGVTDIDVPTPPQQDRIAEISAQVDKIAKALELDGVVDDLTELTKSDIQNIKNQTDMVASKSVETDSTTLTSLNEFMNSMVPALFIAHLATRISHLTHTRVNEEYQGFKSSPTAPPPVAGAVAYSFGLLALFVPLLIFSGSLYSTNLIAAIIGGVAGSLQFDFPAV